MPLFAEISDVGWQVIGSISTALLTILALVVKHMLDRSNAADLKKTTTAEATKVTEKLDNNTALTAATAAKLKVTPEDVVVAKAKEESKHDG